VGFLRSYSRIVHGYDKITQLLVDYILALTPEEQRRVSAAVGQDAAQTHGGANSDAKPRAAQATVLKDRFANTNSKKALEGEHEKENLDDKRPLPAMMCAVLLLADWPRRKLRRSLPLVARGDACGGYADYPASAAAVSGTVKLRRCCAKGRYN